MPQLTFNYGKILTLCIRTRNNVLSLKQQLQRLVLLDKEVLEHMEIVVVDNDSTDGTSTMVRQFEGRLRFKYISNTDNLSQDNCFTFALNQAIQMHTKYIWMLDARNVVRVEHFADLIGVLDKNEFGLVFLSLNQKSRKSLVQYVDIDDFLQVESLGIVDHSRNVIRTDFIRGYNPRDFEAGSGIPAVPLFLHVALSGKQNAVYAPCIINELAAEPIQESRDPIRTYAKNLLAVYDKYEDGLSVGNLSPATLMHLKNKVSDCLLPLIVRLFVLRRGVKGIDAKKSRFIVKQNLGWRPIMAAFRKCVSGKVWGRVIRFIFLVIRKLLTIILAGLTMLICNTLVTRAWRHFVVSITTYRFRYRVRTGKRCLVEPPVIAEGKNITIGTMFHSMPGLHLESISTGNYTPRIVIGDNVTAERNVRISSVRDVRIGNNVVIGQGVIITDYQLGKTDAESLRILPQDRQLIIHGSVVIEDNVVIGPRAIILSGVTIGKGAVVAAGAVVTHNVPAFSVAKGVPAQVNG